MFRPSAPAFRIAMIGALAAVALLGGCGRKGPLELPPSAQIEEPKDSATGKPRPAMTQEGYPIAPPGEKKRIPVDWLID